MDRITALLSASARTARSSVIRDLLHVTERSDVLSLAGGLPAAEMLPTDRLAIAMDRALRRNGAYGPDALQYGATEGVAELRAAIARSAARMDGRTRADDVLVTTGSQQALDLVARTTIDPGDTVVMERPAYLGALQTFAGVGARVVTVVSDAEGLRTDELERHLRGGLRPKLCTIVPNFQNPSGATMPTERRAHLASLAERYGFLIVEDDPYRELRFDGDSLPPLRAHTDLAIGLGSSSKILAPGLRVGWIAAPSPLVDALTRTKQRVDLHTPTLNQLVVLDVLRDVAFLNAHIARLRVCYAARRDALLTALRHHLAGRVEVDRPDGGFFLWARLPGTDTEALLPSAVAAGVAFVPGAAFTTDGSGADRMRLSFASLAPAQLADAAARLATVVAAGEPPLPAARPLLGSPNTYHQAPSAKGRLGKGDRMTPLGLIVMRRSATLLHAVPGLRARLVHEGRTLLEILRPAHPGVAPTGRWITPCAFRAAVSRAVAAHRDGRTLAVLGLPVGVDPAIEIGARQGTSRCDPTTIRSPTRPSSSKRRTRSTAPETTHSRGPSVCWLDAPWRSSSLTSASSSAANRSTALVRRPTPPGRGTPGASPRPRLTAMTARSSHNPGEWHPAIEEYCEAIYELREDDVEVIQARIAERLEVSRPAVSEMIRRLENEGIVEMAGNTITLTEAGQAVAERVVRRHRLAERFLTDILKLSWAEAHQEAGKWEHIISPTVEAAMTRLLGDPTTCPHGNPIPGTDYKVDADTTHLAAVEVGTQFVVTRIPEELEFSPGLLEFLEESTILPGRSGTVTAASPDGTRTIEIDGRHIGIGAFVSERILVTPA